MLLDFFSSTYYLFFSLRHHPFRGNPLGGLPLGGLPLKRWWDPSRKSQWSNQNKTYLETKWLGKQGHPQLYKPKKHKTSKYLGRNNLKQFCNLWHLIHSSLLEVIQCLKPRSNFQTNIQECIYCKRLWIYTVYIGKYVWLQQQASFPTHMQAAHLSATCAADWVFKVLPQLETILLG